MSVDEMIALARAGAELLAIVKKNVSAGKATIATSDLAELKAILDPLHAENLGLSAELDALLATAETK